MREDKRTEVIILIIALFIGVYFGFYGIYVAFSNPELTQTQVLFKLLGVE